MRFYGCFGVLSGPYPFLCIFAGLYWSLCVLIGFNLSL